jgi:hypothetical protein
MSRYYAFRHAVPYEKIINNLPSGLALLTPKEGYRAITDGRNYLQTKAQNNGKDTFMARFGLNDVSHILAKLSGVFGEIIDEEDPAFRRKKFEDLVWFQLGD